MSLLTDWLAGTTADRSNTLLIWSLIRRFCPQWRGGNEQYILGPYTAADVFGEVCLTLLRKEGSYNPARGALSTWVGWMVRATLSNLRKHVTAQCRARLAQWPKIEPSAADHDLYDPPDERDWEARGHRLDLAHLRGVLRRLPRMTRRLLVQRSRVSSDAELGRRMGVTKQAINVRVKHALQLLRGAYYGGLE